MAPALAQLFYPVSGNPQLTLCPVGRDLVPAGKATFAQIVRTVQSSLPGDIVLGWVTYDGENTFAPAPDLERDFVDGDKIILLTRRYFEADALASPVTPKPKKPSGLFL